MGGNHQGGASRGMTRRRFQDVEHRQQAQVATGPDRQAEGGALDKGGNGQSMGQRPVRRPHRGTVTEVGAQGGPEVLPVAQFVDSHLLSDPVGDFTWRQRITFLHRQQAME